MISKRVGKKSDIPDLFIDDIYPLFKYNAVDSIVSCNHTTSLNTDFDYGWDILINEEVKEIEQYYFTIDNIYNDAFGHWVYESAIYLCIFHKLKELYPNIKLLIFSQKNYKKCFFNAFYISEDDIVTEISNKNNCIIFPKYTTHHDGNLGELYSKYINNLYTFITKDINNYNKEYSIVYFPRGSLENYKGNDRVINNQDKIIDLVSSYNNSFIYNTDTTKNFVNQVELLKKTRIFLADYGSNFIVNSFFCENSIIIILGVTVTHELFPAGHIIMDYIKKRNNKIIFIQDTGTLFDYNIETVKNTIDSYYNK
jgi:hypothetical protein